MTNAWIEAGTLSVVMQDSKTVGIHIQLGPEQEDMENYCNATLRLDRGHKAVICGLPQNWAVWNTNLSPYDPDSESCEEYLDSSEMLQEFGYEYSFDRIDEYNALEQIKASILKQIKDPMFRGRINVFKKLAVITMIDNALNAPEFKHIREVA